MPSQDRRPVYKFGAWEINLAHRDLRSPGHQRRVRSIVTLVGAVVAHLLSRGPA
jgi:hypothetical protein